MQSNEAKRFPKRFLWGVSTAAHQVEGNTHNQWTVWELENAKALAAQAEYQLGDLPNWLAIKKRAKQPENYVSGPASQHYTRFEEDFDIAKRLNMNALRFSVEWSRVEPTEGVWDIEAIEHYKRYAHELKRRGIEPMLTLFHFTLPVWFSEMGGFEKRSNVAYFVRFAEKILHELGADIRLVITMHEPELYALRSYHDGVWPPARQSRHEMWRVLHNLAYAHKKTAAAVHALSRRYKVSIATNSAYTYGGDDAWLSRISAHAVQYMSDDYFLKKVYKHCDFLGVNYYVSNRVYGYRVHNPEQQISDVGWDMSPMNLEFALIRLHDKYKLPIIVTENGLADENDKKRKWWLTHTLVAMQRAMAEGVQLEGYFYSNLLDGFDWAHGTWPKYGLVAVHEATAARTVRPSALWFAKIIKKLST